MEPSSIVPLDLQVEADVDICAEATTSLSLNARTKSASKWKHRRSRSTSNLAIGGSSVSGGVTILSDSDESKDANDSDYAERTLAKLSLHSKNSSMTSRAFKKPPSLPVAVESDSFNELFCGTSKQTKIPKSKKRRRYKRIIAEGQQQGVPGPGPGPVEMAMAIEGDTLDGLDVEPMSSTSAINISSSSRMDDGKEINNLDDISIDSIDLGKRKRCQKVLGIDRTLSPAAENLIDKVLNLGHSSGQVPGAGVPVLGLSAGEVEVEMKSTEESDSSSLSSESEMNNFATCLSGQEGDDEQSDWVDPESMDDLELQRRRALIISKMQSTTPLNREIRAGRRRVLSHKPPVFSFRTSANEQLSKFLQNPEQSEIKLHPMRKEEVVQLSHIASLYSLQMHNSHKDSACPILTKTPYTTKMDIEDETSDSNGFITRPSKTTLMASESTTKRKMELILLAQSVGIIGSMIFMSLVFCANYLCFGMVFPGDPKVRLALQLTFNGSFWCGLVLLIPLLFAMGFLIWKIIEAFQKVTTDDPLYLINPSKLYTPLLTNMTVAFIMSRILSYAIGHFHEVQYKRSWIWWVIPWSVKVGREPGNIQTWLITAGILLLLSSLYRSIHLGSILIFRLCGKLGFKSLKEWTSGLLSREKMTIKMINKISDQVKGIQSDVIAFDGTSRDDAKYVQLGEVLTRSQLKLHGIDTLQIEEVKLAKKLCMTLIQNTLDILKEKVENVSVLMNEMGDGDGDGNNGNVVYIDVVEE